MNATNRRSHVARGITVTDDTVDATVLVVDDEKGYLDAYVTWLTDVYEVRTAADGDEALDRLDDAVDVVLLDRRMPGLSGRTVLRTIRERGLDCRVAMVTAVEPDLDIIDMEFDDYLVKPVTEEEVHAVVETLLTRQSLNEQLRECFAIVAKKAALEATIDGETLESTREYQELRRRLSDAETRASESLDELIERGAVVGAYDDVVTRS